MVHEDIGLNVMPAIKKRLNGPDKDALAIMKTDRKSSRRVWVDQIATMALEADAK